MTSQTNFLLRAMTNEEVLELTSIRATLKVTKKRVGIVTFFIVKDRLGKVRSAKGCKRNVKGSGYHFCNAHRFTRADLEGTGPIYREAMADYVRFGWYVDNPHDVVPDLKTAAEWAMREAVLNVTRGITASNLLAARTKLFKFKTKDGRVEFQWVPVTELEEEEGEGYIPERFGPAVLCLNSIETNESGQGQGTRLMELFLAHPEVKKAALVYLDPVPGYGNNHRSKESDATQMLNLARFYSRFGFRSAPGCARMWRVQKGKIQTKDLPT